jgi:hypothetical protein
MPLAQVCCFQQESLSEILILVIILEFSQGIWKKIRRYKRDLDVVILDVIGSKALNCETNAGNDAWRHR